MALSVSSLDLPDHEFITEFERRRLSTNNFPHRAHLRMAWLYVTSLGTDAALEKAAAGIRNLAAAHGHPALYHDTITRAWIYLVADASRKPHREFAEFLEHHPELLDKHLLLRYYSAERLWSPQARASWVPPDLEPIPGVPGSVPGPEQAERQ